jgi:hypothetical protein
MEWAVYGAFYIAMGSLTFLVLVWLLPTPPRSHAWPIAYAIVWPMTWVGFVIFFFRKKR